MLDDKKFVSDMRTFCGDIMQDLCHILKEDYDIGATFYLVRNDYNHPSFICCVEAVNNVYNLRKSW